jgi:hypothetical protein
MQDETAEASSEDPNASSFDRWHDFWLVATPNIFAWFQWAAVLGLLSYVYAKHPSVWLSLLIGLGYLSLIFYFGGFFTRRSVEIPWIKNKRHGAYIWQGIAILLGFGTSMLVQQAVSAFAIGTP